MKAIILIGPPGAGKTTLGSLLSRKLQGHLISPEMFLERELQNDHRSEFGGLDPSWSATERIPDSIMNEIVETLFDEAPEATETFVIEGCVHNEWQMRFLSDLLQNESIGRNDRIGFFLALDPAECLKRLRSSFGEEVALKRFDDYFANFLELPRMMHRYCSHLCQISLNAFEDSERVFERMIREFYFFAGAVFV